MTKSKPRLSLLAMGGKAADKILSAMSRLHGDQVSFAPPSVSPDVGLDGELFVTAHEAGANAAASLFIPDIGPVAETPTINIDSPTLPLLDLPSVLVSLDSPSDPHSTSFLGLQARESTEARFVISVAPAIETNAEEQRPEETRKVHSQEISNKTPGTGSEKRRKRKKQMKNKNRHESHPSSGTEATDSSLAVTHLHGESPKKESTKEITQQQTPVVQTADATDAETTENLETDSGAGLATEANHNHTQVLIVAYLTEAANAAEVETLAAEVTYDKTTTTTSTDVDAAKDHNQKEKPQDGEKTHALVDYDTDTPASEHSGTQPSGYFGSMDAEDYLDYSSHDSQLATAVELTPVVTGESLATTEPADEATTEPEPTDEQAKSADQEYDQTHETERGREPAGHGGGDGDGPVQEPASITFADYFIDSDTEYRAEKTGDLASGSSDNTVAFPANSSADTSDDSYTEVLPGVWVSTAGEELPKMYLLPGSEDAEVVTELPATDLVTKAPPADEAAPLSDEPKDVVVETSLWEANEHMVEISGEEQAAETTVMSEAIPMVEENREEELTTIDTVEAETAVEAALAAPTATPEPTAGVVAATAAQAAPAPVDPSVASLSALLGRYGIALDTGVDPVDAGLVQADVKAALLPIEWALEAFLSALPGCSPRVLGAGASAVMLAAKTSPFSEEASRTLLYGQSSSLVHWGLNLDTTGPVHDVMLRLPIDWFTRWYNAAAMGAVSKDDEGAVPEAVLSTLGAMVGALSSVGAASFAAIRTRQAAGAREAAAAAAAMGNTYEAARLRKVATRLETAGFNASLLADSDRRYPGGLDEGLLWVYRRTLGDASAVPVPSEHHRALALWGFIRWLTRRSTAHRSAFGGVMAELGEHSYLVRLGWLDGASFTPQAGEPTDLVGLSGAAPVSTVEYPLPLMTREELGRVDSGVDDFLGALIGWIQDLDLASMERATKANELNAAVSDASKSSPVTVTGEGSLTSEENNSLAPELSPDVVQPEDTIGREKMASEDVFEVVMEPGDSSENPGQAGSTEITKPTKPTEPKEPAELSVATMSVSPMLPDPSREELERLVPHISALAEVVAKHEKRHRHLRKMFIILLMVNLAALMLFFSYLAIAKPQHLGATEAKLEAVATEQQAWRDETQKRLDGLTTQWDKVHRETSVIVRSISDIKSSIGGVVEAARSLRGVVRDNDSRLGRVSLKATKNGELPVAGWRLPMALPGVPDWLPAEGIKDETQGAAKSANHSAATIQRGQGSSSVDRDDDGGISLTALTLSGPKETDTARLRASFGNAKQEMSSLNTKLKKLFGEMGALFSRLDAQMRLIDTLPVSSPIHGQITSRFGRRSSPINGEESFHNGIDIAASIGSAVAAAADGYVLYAGPARDFGNCVIITHGAMVTAYAHMSETTVKAGDMVVRGAMVGRVGSTGRSTGPHLHFEVRSGGKPVDPLLVFSVGGNTAGGVANLGAAGDKLTR